jgi:heme a synthase
MTLRSYNRLSKVTMVFILLVISAGSIVRSTGSGMGCPDWPKCFGLIIPPTCACELPDNYKEIYSEKRIKKTEKFAKLLSLIGLDEIANKLLNDETIKEEEDFNVVNTWVEYVNRLVGAISGLGVFLMLALLPFVKDKPKGKRRVLYGLALLNLILIAFEGWFGSIVVATNLTPWTISVHMWLALVILVIQTRLIWLSSNKSGFKIDIKYKRVFYIFFLSLLVQIILGTQVRVEVDNFIVKDDVLNQFEIGYFIHRTFSWLILIAFIFTAILNRKLHYGFGILKWIGLIILFEILSGVFMSYFDIPAWNQPVHLLSSSILLCLSTWHLFQLRAKVARESMIR